MAAALIAVRRGPRGPLANYVQAVRRSAVKGMGQDDTAIEDPSTGIYYDSSGAVVPQPVITPISSGLSYDPLSGSFSTSSGSTLATGSPATASNPTGSGFNLSSLLNSLTGAAAGAEKIYLAGQTPSLVPGTNAIYNAATGQFYNPTTGQVVNPSGTSSLFPAGISTANLGPILLYGGLALGAFLLISQLGKG